MDKRTIFSLLCALVLVPATALAYVGPGAGLSLLGALWALLIALGTALVFVIAWPVRRMLRRKQDERERASAAEAEARREQAVRRPGEEPTGPSRAMPEPGTKEAFPSKRP